MQKAQLKQNPFVFYLWMLLYMFIALAVRVCAVAPLWSLKAFESGSPLRWLALLCPLLVVFVVLPSRYAFAEALVQKPGERRFDIYMALSLRNYGDKLMEALKHAAHVLVWGVPVYAMVAYAMHWWNAVDLGAFLGAVINLGKGWSNLWTSIANFFIRLFGSINTLPNNGGIMEGILVIASVLGVGVLIWLFGIMRNSASRYAWVVANREERSPAKMTRRCLRGRRLCQLGTALINLVLWAPFVATVVVTLKGVVGDLSTALMMMLASGSGSALNLAGAVQPLMLAFVLLYMPLLPIRRYLTADFVLRGLSAKDQTANDASFVEQ